MIGPATIEFFPHDPRWRERAAREIERVREALGATLVTAHHVGSTAIPNILAKPILDLVPVVTSLADVDAKQSAIEKLGYEWRGEYGIPERRFCVLLDSEGKRVVHLHVFVRGSREISRHVDFCEYLRAHPAEAKSYEAEKVRARNMHPTDGAAYNEEKTAWIRACESRAGAWAERNR